VVFAHFSRTPASHLKIPCAAVTATDAEASPTVVEAGSFRIALITQSAVAAQKIQQALRAKGKILFYCTSYY